MATTFELSYQYDGCGPNAARIRSSAMRVIRGCLMAQVRKELIAAVKSGHLGRLKKDGLKPEIFFHPDHKTAAIARQKSEAVYSVSCIAKVMTDIPAAERIEQAINSLAG